MPTNMPWTTHYESGVRPTIDIPSMPLTQILRDSARKYPDNIALRMILKYLKFGLVIQSKLTYRELDEMTDRFATALAALGMRKGDRIALMLPNLPQQVIAYFGALKAGTIVVNTNPTYTPRELQHQLYDSGAEAIVTLSGLYNRLAQIRDKTTIKHVILTDVHDTLGWPFDGLVAKQLRSSGLLADVPDAADIYHFFPLLKQHPATPPQVQTSMDDVVLLQYSGGTTGVPKAAMLTQQNLVSNSFQMDEWFRKHRLRQRKGSGRSTLLPRLRHDRWDAFFRHKWAGNCLSFRTQGTQNISCKVIQSEKVTVYPGVPAMYTAIINHPKVREYELHSVKACLSGGAALPVEIATKFEEITGGRLVEGYGLSESSPVAAANPIFGERKVGSVGLPISNTRLAVVSLESDENGNFTELEIGDEGELVIYGPQVMKGYWNNPEETARTIDNGGGLHTGDIGKMDEEGYFYVVDRLKDLIIASGYNVVPREVEEVLFTHPKVMEAAVSRHSSPQTWRDGERLSSF